MIGCFEENILFILSECHFTISSILWLSLCPPGKCQIHCLKKNMSLLLLSTSFQIHTWESPYHLMFNIMKMYWGNRSSTWCNLKLSPKCRCACSSTLDIL